MNSETCGPVRVLQVVSSMDRGGAETMLMNLYRKIDRTRLQFDFLVHRRDPGHYDAEIENLGGRIIRIRSLGQSGPISYLSQVRRAIVTHGPFAAVHSHTDMFGGMVALAARMARVNKRICHSHNTDSGTDDQKSLFWYALGIGLRAFIRVNATQYCACGRDAARYLFGNRAADLPGKVVVLPNAVDLTHFESIRAAGAEEIRNELGISSVQRVICHVGRFYPQKNHRFLIDLAEHIQKKGLPYIFLLVGSGPLREEMEELVRVRNLSGTVKFLGVRSDVPRLLMAADMFILPSFFEGLPVVLVEAQASGVPCTISDNITDEVDMGLGLIRKVSLQSPLDSWQEAIADAVSREVRPPFAEIRKALAGRGYDASASVYSLYELYGVCGPGEK